MTLPDLLILSCATWGLTYLLTKEHGPYNILKRLRALFNLGGLTSCMYCMGLWVALALYALMATPAALVVYALAGYGGALLLHRYTGGDWTGNDPG